MAMNPMQRRARNSFLIGFLLALVVMALVVLLLMRQIKEKDETIAGFKAKQTTVYVAAEDLKSGEILELDKHFKMETVQTTIDRGTIISEDDWKFFDNDGEEIEKIDEQGNPIYKQIMLKVNVPAGEIVTKDMIQEVEDPVVDSDRIVEYNMFILPSTLKNGDYIDIRLSLPSGKDYIVLPKKRVLGCNATTIWLRVSEDEILLLNNAIIESYTISGSKLYASLYSEAGMQTAAEITYMPSPDVMALIINNPNILQDAILAISRRYDPTYRVQHFETAIDPYRESQDSLVASGNSSEVASIKAARQTFVQALEGTEDVGYDR